MFNVHNRYYVKIICLVLLRQTIKIKFLMYIKHLSLSSFFEKVDNYHLSYSSFEDSSGKAFFASYPCFGIVFVSRRFRSLDALFKSLLSSYLL